MPSPPTIGEKHYIFSGRPAGRPAVRCSSTVNQYFVWSNISVLTKDFSANLGTNVHHGIGHCWKGFQSQSSNVQFTARLNALFAAEAYSSTAWRGSFVVAVAAAADIVIIIIKNEEISLLWHNEALTDETGAFWNVLLKKTGKDGKKRMLAIPQTRFLTTQKARSPASGSRSTHSQLTRACRRFIRFLKHSWEPEIAPARRTPRP